MDEKEFGVGEWRQRDGGKAIVTQVVDTDYYSLKGLSAFGTHASWTKSGLAFKEEDSKSDLIAPWEEPATASRGDVTKPGFVPVSNEQPALRDLFAMAALQGLCSNHAFMKEQLKSFNDTVGGDINPDMLRGLHAHTCYQFADAMLAARKAGAA